MCASRYDGKASRTQEAWITPTLQGAWTGDSGVPLQYFKDNFGVVHFRGRVSGGAVGTAIFTMPVGYRPGVLIRFLLNASHQVSYVYFDAGNNCLIASGGLTGVDFTQLSYKAEA